MRRVGYRCSTIAVVIALCAMSACTPFAADPGAGLPVGGCGASVAPHPGHELIGLDRPEGRRTAYLTIPADVRPGVAMPVLFSLHPFLMTPELWESYSGLADRAASRGYLVVSPLGSDPGPRWAVPGGLPGPDDLGFIGALLDRVVSDYCVDPARVFAAGFSAGAAMSEAIGCNLTSRFQAVAASSGANLTSLCPDSPPIDTLILHGTADPIAPPTGSTVIFAPPLGLDVTRVAAGAAARAGCDPLPVESSYRPTVVVDRWTGCGGGHRVEYWKEIGAGHTWAGSKVPLPAFVTGPTNTDIDADTVVLDFFGAAH